MLFATCVIARHARVARRNPVASARATLAGRVPLEGQPRILRQRLSRESPRRPSSWNACDHLRSEDRQVCCCRPGLLTRPQRRARTRRPYIGMNRFVPERTLVVHDPWGNPMCCLPLRLSGQPGQHLGGHFHSLDLGTIRYRFARLSPTTCNTGPGAFGCRVTVESLAAGGGYDIIAYVTSGPHAGRYFVAQPGINIGAYQRHDLSRFEESRGRAPRSGCPLPGRRCDRCAAGGQTTVCTIGFPG